MPENLAYTFITPYGKITFEKDGDDIFITAPLGKTFTYDGKKIIGTSEKIKLI